MFSVPLPIATQYLENSAKVRVSRNHTASGVDPFEYKGGKYAASRPKFNLHKLHVIVGPVTKIVARVYRMRIYSMPKIDG